MNINNSHSENISSSVLFTFTTKLDYLLDMLNFGIFPRYVYERLPGTKFYYIVPMKCFCDIPLGKVKNHMVRYGHYGIGLKKTFLQKIGTTPVIYIHKHSESFFRIKKIKEMSLEKFPYLPLLKRYLGDDYFFDENNNSMRKRIRFYDEREWRYLPSGFKLSNTDNLFTIEEGQRFVSEMNTKNPFKESPIVFTDESIEYIIIQNKNELPDFINRLKLKFTRDELDFILTKIIISKQILKDF
jgi:hypothetical protein